LVSMTERAELAYGVLIALAEVLQGLAEKGQPDLASAARLAQVAESIEAAAKIPEGAAAATSTATTTATATSTLLDRLEGHVANLLDQRAPLQLSGAP